MKLFQLVMWRMSTILVVILTCWAVLFYLAIMEEVNDEVDDSLSDYAESLILRSLSGEQMPDTSNGSNNQYFLYEVTPEYAASYPNISYRDEMVYITEKGETEPARILMTIFQKEDRKRRDGTCQNINDHFPEGGWGIHGAGGLYSHH